MKRTEAKELAAATIKMLKEFRSDLTPKDMKVVFSNAYRMINTKD